MTVFTNAQVRELLEQGATYQHVAATLGTTRQRVAAIARDLGLPPRRQPPDTTYDATLVATHRQVERAEARLQQARAARVSAVQAAVAAGVSVYRVAQVMHLPRTTVADILQRAAGASDNPEDQNS